MLELSLINTEKNTKIDMQKCELKLFQINEVERQRYKDNV